MQTLQRLGIFQHFGRAVVPKITFFGLKMANFSIFDEFFDFDEFFHFLPIFLLFFAQKLKKRKHATCSHYHNFKSQK